VFDWSVVACHSLQARGIVACLLHRAFWVLICHLQTKRCPSVVSFHILKCELFNGLLNVRTLEGQHGWIQQFEAATIRFLKFSQLSFRFQDVYSSALDILHFKANRTKDH